MRKNHIPKVVFQLPSIGREASIFVKFLETAPEAWKNHIFRRHPALEEALGNETDTEKRYRICHQYAKNFRRAQAKQFKYALKKNEELWRPVEEEYLKTLSEHFETTYPRNERVMRAYISMIPIYPRWLDEWSFNVSVFSPERVREIACHEIQHFVYFKKWSEVFPETKKEEFNKPHLVWMLSELVDPVILNEHPKFKKLFTRKQATYTHFQKIRIDGKQPTTHLARLYRKHLKAEAPFEDFLREIWHFAQENEKLLLEAC